MIDLNKLQKKLDEALAKTSGDSFDEWMKSKGYDINPKGDYCGLEDVYNALDLELDNNNDKQSIINETGFYSWSFDNFLINDFLPANNDLINSIITYSDSFLIDALPFVRSPLLNEQFICNEMVWESIKNDDNNLKNTLFLGNSVLTNSVMMKPCYNKNYIKDISVEEVDGLPKAA